jgi:hypothetical protein
MEVARPREAIGDGLGMVGEGEVADPQRLGMRIDAPRGGELRQVTVMISTDEEHLDVDAVSPGRYMVSYARGNTLSSVDEVTEHIELPRAGSIDDLPKPAEFVGELAGRHRYASLTKCLVLSPVEVGNKEGRLDWPPHSAFRHQVKAMASNLEVGLALVVV